MIEPNGPLPQYVYWRRRAFAAGASVLSVVLLAWIIGGLVEADDQHPVQGTADASGIGADPTAAAASVTTSASAPPSGPASAPPSSPGPDDPRGSTTVSPSTTAPAAPTTTTTTPAPPQACADAVVKVIATPDVPSYPVGARPLLRLTVTNVSAVPCTRDVSRQLREILVQGMDGARLWSSNDCYGQPEQDVRLLQPQQAAEFSVNWAGRTSAPGCPENRAPVPAGTYQVIGKLGGLVGAPTPLTLT